MAIPDFNIQPMPPIDISTGLRFLQQQQENLMKEASDLMNAKARMEQAQVASRTLDVRRQELQEEQRQFDLDADNRRRDSLTRERNSMTSAKVADTDRLEFYDRSNEHRRVMEALGQEYLMQQSKERVASYNKSAGRFRGIADMAVGAMRVITQLSQSSTQRQVAALEARSSEKHSGAMMYVADRGLEGDQAGADAQVEVCLLYTSPSPRDVEESRMPSSA